MTPTVLVVEADVSRAQPFLAALAARGLPTTHARTKDDASSAKSLGAAIVSLDSARLDGLSVVSQLRSTQPSLPIIAVAGSPSAETMLKLLRARVADVFAGTNEAEALATALARVMKGAAAGPSEELASMEIIERRHILKVLAATGGHRTRAAQILGLDRKTLYRKLESYDPGEVQQALTARAGV